MEAFDKVCKVLNRVYNAKWIDRDLRVLAVLWAYRTMCKNLTAQAPQRLEYETNIVSPLELEKPNPTLVGMMVCGTLEAEIQQGNIRLEELEEERVRLRKKSALVDVEVKKLEDEIKEDFLTEKTRMVRQGVYDHADKFEHYCRELISLMPWLGLHIAKHSD